MLFRLRNAKEVKRTGFTAFVYSQKSEFPELNTVYVDCHGSHERCYVKNSYRLYFVLEGTGKFQVGEEEYKVQKHDVVVIPPKTEYSYNGQMKLFEANFPATSSEDEVKVE